MKSLLITAVVGLIFFGGAYAYSTMQLVQKEEDKKEVAKNEDGDAQSGSFSAGINPIQPMIGANGKPLPAPFQSKSLSERTILDLAESVKAKEMLLRGREQELNRREAKMQFILTDIQREKREFESVVKEAQTRVTEGQRILKLIETKKQKIENDLKQIKDLQEGESAKQTLGQEIGQTETAALIETLEPAQLAETIVGFANDGELERVGILLSKFDKKNAAKAIAAIEDSTLRQQVLNATTDAFAKQATLLDQKKKKR
ncbi:hypothetical protein OAF34_00175 [Pirellulaceae bacterium]|jgi:hypothetical protein|nr:hypothetical protein [Pirellulaceae bacterium]